MRATLFGIAAAALTAAVFATPASALPAPGGVDAAGTVHKSQVVVKRTVVRRPGVPFVAPMRRCRTVVTRVVGPMGGVKVVKKQVCG